MIDAVRALTFWHFCANALLSIFSLTGVESFPRLKLLRPMPARNSSTLTQCAKSWRNYRDARENRHAPSPDTIDPLTYIGNQRARPRLRLHAGPRQVFRAPCRSFQILTTSRLRGLREGTAGRSKTGCQVNHNVELLRSPERFQSARVANAEQFLRDLQRYPTTLRQRQPFRRGKSKRSAPSGLHYLSGQGRFASDVRVQKIFARAPAV